MSWRDSVPAVNRPNHPATAVSSSPGKIQRTSRVRIPPVSGLSGCATVITDAPTAPATPASVLGCQAARLPACVHRSPAPGGGTIRLLMQLHVLLICGNTNRDRVRPADELQPGETSR